MGILSWLVAALYCNAVLAEIVYYDTYSSAVITPQEKSTRDAQGNTYYCVNAIETCSETEGRRLDGSCNNLKHPSAGAGHYQFDRLLPAYYNVFDGNSARLKADNTELPNARTVRTTILPDGSAIGPEFSQLGLFYVTFITLDFTLSTGVDATFSFANTTDCCTAAGALNPMCTPIAVPEDDTLSLVSGITCLNLTRNVDFQYEGCIGAGITPPSRIQYGAANLDMKPVYGSDPQTSLVRQRLFEGGLFNYSMAADGKQWPEYTPSSPADGMSIAAGHTYFFSIMHWREHNRIASELSKLNPSWSDDKLFETAREIAIAEYTQILYYEALAHIFGYDNLVRDGVLLPASGGFRDVYDEEVLPGWWTESIYAFRWFHSTERATLERYTLEGEYYDEVKLSLTIPGSQLNSGNNMTYLAQGLFRSVNGKVDDRFDGFLGETALGVDPTLIPYQKVFDLGAVDLGRGRSMGLAPYTEVLHFCEGANYDDFDSLSEHLDEDAIEKLKELYQTDDVTDIELLAGMWREKLYPGAKVPRSVYCLIVKQLQRNIQSDRHWYERPNRPNAFTEAQLAEIRKTSMSRMFCDNIGGITESGITANPYQPISDDNPIVSCDAIPRGDLSAWKEDSSTTPATPTKATTPATPITPTTATKPTTSTSTQTSAGVVGNLVNNLNKIVNILI